ncbi:hypothetical protein L6R52_01275 [Myxococcota bacterium]|nr:hypothetical protein [Myxococcota bacterium]
MVVRNVPPVHGRSWVGQIQNVRTRAEVKAPAADGVDAGPRRGEGAKADGLRGLLVPEKVIAAHGASLEGAIGDVARLRELTGSLEPHKAKQLERLLDQLYKVLGVQLSLVPAAERPAVAARMMGATRGLADALASSGELVPTMFALVGLFDSGARLQAQKRLDVGAAGVAQLAERASDALRALSSRLEGRGGVAAAINLFPNLVEQLERAAGPLDVEGRARLWSAATELLAGAVPARGFALEHAAHVSEVLAAELAKNPGKGAEAGAKAARSALVTEGAPRLDATNAAVVRADALPEIGQALARVLEAHPLGPEALFEAVVALRQHADQAIAENVPDNLALWRSTAELVARVADRPIALEVVKRLGELVPKAIGRGDKGNKQAVLDAMARAAATDDGHAIARALFDLKLAIKNRPAADYPELEAALAELGGIDADRAMLVSLAVTQRLNSQPAAAPMLRGAIALAKGSLGDDPWRALDGYVERFTAVHTGLANQVAAEEVMGLADVIARVTSGTKVENLDRIVELITTLKNTLPRLDLGEALAPDAHGRSAALALVDPSVRYRTPPLPFLARTAAQLQNWAWQDAGRPREAARIAIDLAARMANLDGNPEVPFARALGDLATAAAEPHRLTAANGPKSAVALRAAQKQTLEAFLDAHPELPIELAATAGLHLSTDQVAWLSTRIAGAKGRDTVRALRDFVLGCVDAGQLALLEAVRTTRATSKAASRVITLVGREYRASRLDRVPFAELEAGMKKGADVVLEMEKKRLEAGMRALEGAAPAAVDPEAGRKMLEKCGPAITNCLEFYKNGAHQDAGIDYAACATALEASVRALQEGRWPSAKYDTPVGRRLLASLTPEQEQVWRQEVVTPAAGAMPVIERQAVPAVTELVRGLQKALPLSFRLAPGVEWTEASLAALRAKQAELLGGLHAAQKGSADHKRLGAELGAISGSLTVLALKVAIDQAVAGGLDGRATLLALRGELSGAAHVLRRARAVGAADAVEELADAASKIRDVKQPAKFGRYAVDEDSLDALMLSHTQTSGSCLNNVNGFRRWGLAGSVADANIRMLRTYDGDKFSYRAFMKVFPVEMPGYKGPALWLDEPLAEGPAQGDDLELLYKTAIHKAQAMGIPVMAPSAMLTQTGQKLGHATQAANVRFSIDEGNTGAMHSDYLFGGAGNLRALRGQNPVAIVDRQAQVVMPR